MMMILMLSYHLDDCSKLFTDVILLLVVDSDH